MSSIKDYITALAERYGGEIEYTESKYDENTLSLAPDAIRGVYQEYEEIKFPFGYMYSIEAAVEESKEEPYKSEGWFCFGFDGSFSYWLCKLTPDGKNLSFVSWDHDIEELDGAVYETALEFLQGEQEKYDISCNIGSVMLISLPSSLTMQ